MVEVAEGRRLDVQGVEADVGQGLVVDAEGHGGVLDEVVSGKHCVVRLHHSV